MTVRALVPGDVAGLAAGLARLPLMVRYGRGEERLRADLEAARLRGDGLLVEESGGAVRGLAWFLPAGTFGMGAYLKLIALLPSALGGGAGLELLRAFEAEAARASRHAFLLVSDFNAGAQRFYERHGWTRVGAIPGLVLPDVAELVYWKRVRA